MSWVTVCVEQDFDELEERSDADSVGVGVCSGVGVGEDLYVGLPLGPTVMEGNDIEKPGGPGGPPGFGGG